MARQRGRRIVGAMPSGFHVRRATIDDLPGLQTMWRALALPAEDLKNRLTEFQVIETPAGLLGAVGCEIQGTEGRIHSEVFSDFGYADHFRPHLWQRIEALARSHGIVRLWTRETASYWKRNGFRAADASQLRKLPEAWQAQGAGWLCQQLREDLDEAGIQARIEEMQRAERRQAHRLARHGRNLRMLATLAAVLLALFVMGVVLYLARNHTPPPAH